MKEKIDFTEVEISFDETHHLYRGKPLYAKRFKKVMSFHPPGVAAVEDETGAYHIDLSGNPIYKERYIKVYGYYEGIATVVDDKGYFHIDLNGKPIHNKRFAWAGNFQEGRCVIRDFDGLYYHIKRNGELAYSERYRYVGDFKYGIAVVYDYNGLATHIDKNGNKIHGKYYLELGVYHKGYAIARDHEGYFHIDKKGEELYPERFKWVENFYNDYALCKNKMDELVIIDYNGNIVHKISPDDKIESVDSSTIIKLKNEIVRFAHLIYEKGYNNGIDGNISVRLSKDKLLMTGSGSAMGFLAVEDIVITDLDGNLIRGTKKPTSEYRLHTWIYKHRSDVSAVIHVHAPFATACSIANIDLIKMYTTIAPIPTTKYAMPSSQEGPERIKEYIDKYDWFILPRHGVVTVGRTLKDAFFRLESVEKVAKIVLMAKSASEKIESLPKREVEKLLKFYGLEHQIEDVIGGDDN